jgi:hypothetical protein
VEAAEADEALTAGAETAANLKPGGWTPFAKVTSDAQKVFDEVLKGLLGVGYTPLSVTSQVVNGTNHVFAVNAKLVYPNSREYPAPIRVFKPLNGPARIAKIHALGSPAAYADGFSPFHETTREEKAVLQKALSGLAGTRYEALLTSVQVVVGFNYRFIGTQTPVTARADSFPVLFTVHQPHSGSPVFTGAQKVYDLV